MTAMPTAARLSPERIARSSGSSFLVSFFFMAPGRRRALLAIYAFCRVVDDAVDLLPREGHGEAEARLLFWERELSDAFAGEPRTPLGFALHRASLRFGLEEAPLRELCEGVRMDLDPRPFERFEDLAGYMRKVASAVGVACLPVFGADRTKAVPYADALGLALQYTNILRDLAEDTEAGRCYLPKEVLEEHGLRAAEIRPDSLKDPGKRETIASLLEAEVARARELYLRADRLLPPEEFRALRPARIMRRIYGDLLERIARRGPAVLEPPRERVPFHRKLFLACFGL